MFRKYGLARKNPKIFWAALITLDAAAMALFGLMLYSAVKARFSPRPPAQPVEIAGEGTQKDFMKTSVRRAEAPPQKAEPVLVEAPETAPSEPEITAAPPQPQPELAQPPAKESQLAIPAAKPQPKEKIRKVVVRYYSSSAKTVAVSGSFSSWRPKPLSKTKSGWEIPLYMYKGKYQYHFLVDGKKLPDPLQPLRCGGESCLIVP